MRMIYSMKRKVALVVACIMFSLTASAAANSVSYVDYTWSEESKTLSSETKSVDTYTEITSTTTEMTSGWYVVNGEVTVAERMTATGEVHLILADGAHLNASLGITVNEGNSLYIYGQSSDESTMGKLTATTTSSDAAIGGLMWNHAGTIVINGGNINASASNEGAGIGSGAYCGGYQITINAGVVTATANSGSAAIGSGNNGGTAAVWGTVHSICINGGVVNATVTANGGAAIGGGSSFDGGDITITGGTVTATNKNAGAAIGGGKSGSGGNITITGGNVTATYTQSVYYGVAIGAGYQGESAGNILITGGTVTATSNRGCGIGVYNGDNGRIVILGGTVNASGSGTVHINAGASGSMMLVDGTTVTISGAFTLQTDFVLPEGYTLEISEGATLTIPEGVTLTLPEEYTLISNGTVNAVGTVNCITHKYVEGVCICGLECSHVGGTPTCTAPAVCTTCGTAYGEVDSTNHNWENGVCTYGCNTIHEPHDWSGKDGICTVCNHVCDHIGHTNPIYTATNNAITESCSTCKATLGATVTITATDATYDGTAKKTATVAYDTGWTGDRNLTVTYENNVNAGTAIASITLGGVTARTTFTIQPKEITGAAVTIQGASFVYSGEPFTPAVSVTLDGKSLAVSDYQVSYADNVNAGQATVTVSGRGNYSGSATATFTIAKAPAPTLPAVTVFRNYAVAKVSVPTGIVAGEGSSVSVGTASGSGSEKVGDVALDAKGNLTFTLSGGANDDEIVLPVSIQSPNYEGIITATVTVTLTDKLDQRPLTVKAGKSTVDAGGTLELSNSGGSGKGAVTYEVINGTGSASLSGSTLTGGASGTVTVIATKAGTGQYNPARSQPFVITIE